MKHTVEHPEKAYNNFKFLNSPDARIVRILSEFMEPQYRFRRHGIRDTIVFFGSARIKPRRQAFEELREIKKSLEGLTRLSPTQRTRLRSAESMVEMSRYYKDTVELAR